MYAVSSSICSIEAMHGFAILAETTCMQGNNFETTLAHASELTNLNLFCYFIFLSHTRKPVFVALPKGLCCSLCCVSRDTHRSLNGDYF